MSCVVQSLVPPLTLLVCDVVTTVILCAVGSIPVQLDIYKSCREGPKHRDNNMCSRTLIGTLSREEPKHRKDLGRSEDLRSGLGTQSRFGKRKNGLNEK